MVRCSVKVSRQPPPAKDQHYSVMACFLASLGDACMQTALSLCMKEQTATSQPDTGLALATHSSCTITQLHSAPIHRMRTFSEHGDVASGGSFPRAAPSTPGQLPSRPRPAPVDMPVATAAQPSTNLPMHPAAIPHTAALLRPGRPPDGLPPAGTGAGSQARTDAYATAQALLVASSQQSGDLRGGCCDPLRLHVGWILPEIWMLSQSCSHSFSCLALVQSLGQVLCACICNSNGTADS